ncbi:PREDICTED: uncharacterized protein LOC105360086 [Ceratosolen solmsi marchali]|uniref:Uncharacterized protein LOC105360086 n=1 Tax=Ceratosolen solmsi marchali TaxID=326594 RepID=A0AAJ6YC96_9HYME|nr:PREDICTED: uncharacterized protein LOC105360086 [Ceratosolen solmsi marchali]
MGRVNKSLLILATILYAQSFTQALENRSFKKEWTFQGYRVFKYSRDIATDDNSFLYAVCTEDKLPAEMNCNVTIETPILPWSNTSRIESCDLNLIGSGDGELRQEVTGIVSVERLSKDRVIVVWWERRRNSQYQIQNIKVSLVRMANCTNRILTFPVNAAGRVLLSNVLVYPTGFDVVVSHKASCVNSSTCRLSHDLEGQRVGEPVAFVSNFDAVYTQLISPTSPDKGLYLSGADIDAWTFRAMHVSSIGVETNLVIARVPDPRKIQRATSNAHELYGICLMVDGRIRCAQFDAQAHTKLDTYIGVPGNIQWLAVHNIANGGLLLLTGHCKSHKCRSFRIAMIRENGRRAGKSLDVPDLDLKCSRLPRDLVVDVAETRTEFCFYFACAYARKTLEKDAKSVVTFSSKCVPKLVIQHD